MKQELAEAYGKQAIQLKLAKECVDRLENILTTNGYTPSADGKTWKPPVNMDAYAPRLFEAENRIKHLVSEILFLIETASFRDTRTDLFICDTDALKADIIERFGLELPNEKISR